MATAQVNGSALTSTPYGTFTQAVNDGGTMKANGTVSSNVMSDVGTATPQVGVVGSTVIDNGWADKAVSGGTFAHNHTNPISALVTTELAGLADTAIKNPGAKEAVRGINKFETDESALLTTAIRDGKFNRYTGAWDSGYPSGVTVSFSQDDAAVPSGAVPGELTYMAGSVVPTNDEYAPRYNG